MDINIQFKNLIQKNLSENGFPQKKVSFSLETLYEMAEKKEANLNLVLEQMEEEGIAHDKGLDKITFSSKATPFDFENLQSMPNMDQAKEMMNNMSPEQMAKIQETLSNMSPEEKNGLIEQAKKMGLI